MNETRELDQPPVVTWYYVYCGLVSLVYVVAILLVAFFMTVGASWLEMDRTAALILTVLIGGGSAACLIPFLAAFFLPRKPWVWVYGLVLICVGFTSCLVLPISIALLIFWIRPETQTYFGREV